jgi:hypothetical protein
VHGVPGDMPFLEAEVAFSPYLSPLPIRTYVDFHGVGVTLFTHTPAGPPSGQPVGSQFSPGSFPHFRPPHDGPLGDVHFGHERMVQRWFPSERLAEGETCPGGSCTDRAFGAPFRGLFSGGVGEHSFLPPVTAFQWFGAKFVAEDMDLDRGSPEPEPEPCRGPTSHTQTTHIHFVIIGSRGNTGRGKGIPTHTSLSLNIFRGWPLGPSEARQDGLFRRGGWRGLVPVRLP